MVSDTAGVIVVGVDGSPTSSAAVAWAAQDAELHGSELKLVAVVPPVVVPAAPWPLISSLTGFSGWEENRARELVEHAHKQALDLTSPRRAAQITTEVRSGPVAPTLVELSEYARLVVVGCVGEGAVVRALMGSVSSGLLQHARCPVAVIHGDRHAPPQAPVVLGIDGSPASEHATEIAFAEASRRGVGLVALHAWSDMGPLGVPPTDWSPIEWANIRVSEDEVLAERLAGWQDRYPDVDVHRVVVCDRPGPRLLEAAETAALLVVGSHGRGGFSGMLLGSVSRAVVYSARIPVIVARGR